MSDIQQLYSPDGRFFILLGSSEMRMSHWVTSAALWEEAPRRMLLRLGDELWSAEQVAWRADSRGFSVELRRYPGDAPSLRLDVQLDPPLITPRAPADPQPLAFGALDAFLARFYARHRRPGGAGAEG